MEPQAKSMKKIYGYDNVVCSKIALKVQEFAMTTKITRRNLLKGAASSSALATCGSLISVQASAAGTKISMQLGWLASNGIIGEVYAKREGFFEEEGVELEVVPGGPGVDGVASVAAGRAQLGQLSSSPSLMLARSAGIPVKAFGAGFQKHPFTYFSLDNAPIRSAKDFVGKTIATQPTAVILLRAALAQNGISEDQVEIVKMGSDMNQLLTGQAHAVTGWLTNVNALKVIGDGRVDLMLWDAGLQLYANVYYTTDTILANEHDALVSFLTGAARGWEGARKNPTKAVDHLVSEYPNLDRDSELEAIKGVLSFGFNSVTKRDGWAAMNRKNWQAQLDIYDDLNQFKGITPSVDDVMTLSVLDATEQLRKRIG